MLEQILQDTNWFREECINTIGQIEMFRKHHVKNQARNAVQFADDVFFIEFSYWPEDFPNFVIQTNIGLVEDNQKVALWFLLRMLQINDTISKEFKNRVDLRNLLTSIGVDILTKYHMKIFSANNIKNTYLEMAENIQMKYEEERIKLLKDEISFKFKNKNYQDLVELVDANKGLCSDIKILKMYEYSLKHRN